MADQEVAVRVTPATPPIPSQSPSRTPTPTKPATPGDNGDPIAPRATLYAGDLDPSVTEEDLNNAFRFMGQIESIRLCRDSVTGNSLRYAYVNFYSFSHASKALACLNHTELKGKPMRLMWSQRDPLVRKIGVGNLFVKNLDSSITSAHLQKLFCKFGNILSCKVAEENGTSKGFGFVQFDSEESAKAAIHHLHDKIVQGKKLYVAKFVKRSERIVANEELTFTNLFVRNLDDDITEDLLRETFSPFGKVSSVAIVKDDLGNSRGFGFVKFELPEEAKKAAEMLNGSMLGSKLLFVEMARQKDGKTLLHYQLEKFKNSNLCVKNLDASVDENKLIQLFSCCGEIVSVRVMRLKNGGSKGFGFVCFSTHEEAKRALKKLNGTVLEGKPLRLLFARNDYDQGSGNDHFPLSRERQYSNWTNSTYFVPPVHYNFPLCTPSQAALKCQPLVYRFDNNYDACFPYVLQNYMHYFAQNKPLKQGHLAKYQLQQNPPLLSKK